VLSELAEVARGTVVDGGYPLYLICRRAAHMYNSSGRDIHMLIRKGGAYNPAFMHPSDLADLGLSSGDAVKITSLHGSINALIEADTTLRSGTVSMTHSFGDLPENHVDFRTEGSNPSQLTNVEDGFDRYSGIPRMSGLPVRIEPLRAGVSRTSH
jgi:anaerobic selenocysteine-containing dehydrogenase